MSLALLSLSTSLAAQSVLTMGFAATLGSGWQIQGADVGIVRPLRVGPVRKWSAVGRVASFIDQGAFIGGQRGVVGALALGVRTSSVMVAELGNDPDVTRITFDVTLEAAGYLAANSPLPQGAAWVSTGILPAIRMGNPGTMQFTVLVGPTWFLGPESGVRGFLGLRAEVPLARGGRASRVSYRAPLSAPLE
jgi:hypothetical protein